MVHLHRHLPCHTIQFHRHLPCHAIQFHRHLPCHTIQFHTIQFHTVRGVSPFSGFWSSRYPTKARTSVYRVAACGGGLRSGVACSTALCVWPLRPADLPWSKGCEPRMSHNLISFHNSRNISRYVRGTTPGNRAHTKTQDM